MSQPSRKDVMRPYEYLAIAAVLALFSGIVALATTRDPIVAIIGFGAVFILTLMTLALLAMAIKPDEKELSDLEDQDRKQGPTLH
ncbi:hypothetical protein FVA74_00140 [Salinibacterium sp. dk2585]|uniref:hypothetical protein n=1 Tax=unclassified Salinibacterium TaxID=2632331 RepID=UPI0011C24962|nr:MULTISPECIES: hypothetical protein [unclassified Salinibacterium]QEE60141.1 hypothetical protein FVA74_00140 [Salinibacterium sp. dk2585]TXK55213.1 hypothetical protein FVP63_00285 [Salinibacterium sp. dk5596]